MSATDDLLQNASAYAKSFDNGEVPLLPARKVAVLACMDSRMDLVGLLGLELGDAHMIRNAGGVVTDDAIRSLAISQRMLGTREIVLLHHTDCGMLTFSDDEFKRSLLDETGIKPAWAVEAFDDSTRTCASRSLASRRARSSPTRTPCAALSTTCTRVRCARFPERCRIGPEVR